MRVVKDCVLTKEGLTVLQGMLARARLNRGSIEVMAKKHVIIIRKSMTEHVRGIIKKRSIDNQGIG